MNFINRKDEVIVIEDEPKQKKKKLEISCNGCGRDISKGSLCESCKKDKICPMKEKCQKNINCSCSRVGCNDCINICFVCTDNVCLECQGDFCCICKTTCCLKPNCMAQINTCNGVDHIDFGGYCVDCTKEEECLNCGNWFCDNCRGEEDCPGCENDSEDEEEENDSDDE